MAQDRNDSPGRVNTDSSDSSLSVRGLKIASISGVIKTKRLEYFRRQLFRFARGKIILSHESFTNEMMRKISKKDDPSSHENMSAFVVISPLNNSKEGSLIRKISALCSSCEVKLINLPSTLDGFSEAIKSLEAEFKELSNLRVTMKDSLLQKLQSLAEENKVS